IRHDLDLEKVGTVGDVPHSMSRIQLGTEGRFKDRPFIVVGRIVYRYGRGHWSEWHIRLSDDASAWLSDAQGEYVITRQTALPDTITAARRLRVGHDVVIDNTLFTV